MKKKTLSLMLLSAISFFNFSYGQNLVPNWSFEDTVSCPIGISAIDDAIGWSSFRQSPDYFNSCNGGAVSTPLNLDGFQYPKSGNAYAGIVTFAKYSGNFREYLGIQLIQQLMIGKKYFVSFYASKSFSSMYHNDIATNKIGARFSTISYSYSNPVPIDNYAQISCDSIIRDTINWYKVSGFFIADSTYNYVSIGNYFNDSLTLHESNDSTASIGYYYIDDVSVTMDTSNTSVEENFQFNIEIYPNPAEKWIYIMGREPQSICVLDVFGRKVIDVTSASTLNLLDLSILCKGIYFIKVDVLDKVYIKKIIHN